MIEVSLAVTPAGRQWPAGNRGRPRKIGSCSDLPIRSLPPPLKALQQHRPPSSLAALPFSRVGTDLPALSSARDDTPLQLSTVIDGGDGHKPAHRRGVNKAC